MDNQTPINENIESVASPGAGYLLIFRRHPINLLAPALVSSFMILMLAFFIITLSLLGLFPMPDSLPYISLFSGVLLFLIMTKERV